jgi:hypothetical protein
MEFVTTGKIIRQPKAGKAVNQLPIMPCAAELE